MIQIFGTNKSFDCKAAQRFFKERRIPFQFVDLKEKEMSQGEFDSVVTALTKTQGSRADAIEALTDKSSKNYSTTSLNDFKALYKNRIAQSYIIHPKNFVKMDDIVISSMFR